jgi:hypothetical protein
MEYQQDVRSSLGGVIADLLGLRNIERDWRMWTAGQCLSLSFGACDAEIPSEV